MAKITSAGGIEAVMNENTSGNSGHGVRPESPPLWLTVEEAAALLRVRVSWLYERTRRGEIPGCVKLGGMLFFDREPALAWLRRCDDRMSTGVRMFAGVLIRRAVAAKCHPTCLARP